MAKSPRVGDLLWGEPSPDVQHAWDAGARFISREARIIGVLGEPGPEQRLTLIPLDGDVVVKVAVHPTGASAIERERDNLMQLNATPWRHLGPGLRGDLQVATASHPLLVMDRLNGRHPSWDDKAVHARLRSSLTATSNGGPEHAGAGLFHGDVTPWNVVQTRDGSLRLLDWEYADLSTSAHPICGILDFVLRGAVVARARASRVRPILRDAVRPTGDTTSVLRDVVDLYREYRDSVAKRGGDHPDAISRGADRLLVACTTAEART